MLMCNEKYPCLGPIELLCTINKTLYGILNLLRTTTTPTHDAMLYYNDKFEIPSGCNIKTLKDVIKKVAPLGVPLHGIHKSQVVRQLFFRQSGHTQYSKIEYEIIELQNDEDVLNIFISRIQPLEAFFSNKNFSYF
ncbi:hypothetical protein HKD37_19G053617 [Glycine soja]